MKLIDSGLLSNLTKQAARCPRLRAHHLLHASHEDAVQRLLIAAEPGTYVQPHRHLHPPRWEWLTVMCGAAAFLRFDDRGRVMERLELRAQGQIMGVEAEAGVWHSLACLEPDTILVECKPGPYAPIAPQDLAAWAPAEGEVGWDDYARWLQRARPGERFRFHQDDPTACT
jgi:cupin fold WbuC family metalloprotein